jgi:hypothetical protein
MDNPRRPRPADVSPYCGRLIAVGTRHGKQHQFAPAFRDVLRAELLTPPDLDTDRFGTFTGDVARRGGPVEAARGKARLAMDLTGLRFGLASEASYGPLAGSGFSGHEEILLFCDDDAGIEVLEGHRSPGVPGGSHEVTVGGDIPPALLDALPDQALIVRGRSGGQEITKGITDAAALRRAVEDAARRSPDGTAVVEPDLRAHHNPSRRVVLARLAERMARRLATRCPVCSAPGFGRVGTEPGLPCRLCDDPTPLPSNEIHACSGCAHQVRMPVADGAADPAHCPACNP